MTKLKSSKEYLLMLQSMIQKRKELIELIDSKEIIKIKVSLEIVKLEDSIKKLDMKIAVQTIK